MTAISTTQEPSHEPPTRRPAGAWRRYGHAALWVVTVGAVALLCAADLFPQWLADRSQPYLTLAAATFVVQTLQFHIALACLLCFAVAALRRRWRLVVIAGMGAALGFAPSVRAAFARGGAPAPAGATMRVMSVNLYVHNRNADSIVSTVRRAAPDVLVLQEYTTALDAPLRTALADDFPYQLRKPMENSGNGWAIYSRRPLLAPIDTALRVGDSTRQARVGVRLGDQEVVIYALHLTSPQSVHKIGRNRAEVADLVQLVAAETKPVILAGDLNFTDSTANAAALRGAGLRSTHDLAGTGRGSTWRYRKLGLTHRLPGFRIDHVFIGPALTCTNAQVLDVAGSDHRPIIADIALAAQEPPMAPVATAE
jgi:endonuclease/exonuclease/phosphatase (EEP) superfamily protein YafD